MMNDSILKETLEALGDEIPVGKFSNFNLLITKYPKYKEGKFEIYNGWEYNIRPDLKNSAYLYSQVRKVDLEIGLKLKEFCLKTDWRMIIGLGSESVYETSITLHHIYGFPYIPGQAVKGVIRNYIISEYFSDELDKAKENSKHDIDKAVEQDDSFIYIFGSQTQQGKVVFFDALPVTIPVIEQDVMTPHYGNYYSDSKNKQPPADYLSPNPIPFLTVKDTMFGFNIGVKQQVLKKLPQDGKLASEIKKDGILAFMKKAGIQALGTYGIGAKTAVGYGYFSEEELPENFVDLMNEIEEESRSEKEKQAEKNREIIVSISNNFSLINVKEVVRRIEEFVVNQDFRYLLLGSILRAVTKIENYQALKTKEERWDLINTSQEFKRYLEKQEEIDLLDEYYIRFESIIKKYSSNKRNQKWKKEKNEWREKNKRILT